MNATSSLPSRAWVFPLWAGGIHDESNREAVRLITRDEELNIVTDSGEYQEALLTSDEGSIIDALLRDAHPRATGALA